MGGRHRAVARSHPGMQWKPPWAGAARATAVIASVLVCAAASAAAGDGARAPDGNAEGIWQADSGNRSVALLELYTSEGCSSCPPADRWLSSLVTDPALWREVVPVAFHVTYWDGLGWVDRFARPAYDARQRQVAGQAGSGVYTPGVFLDGREWRRWRHTGTASFAAPAGAGGRLSAALPDAGGGVARIVFEDAGRHDALDVRLAWLLSGEDSAVRSGENGGRQLHHDFVVQHLDVAALHRVDGAWRAEVPIDPALRAGSRALAVWVSDPAGRPLQAAGGWL